MNYWFVPMTNDTREFETFEGGTIKVARHDVTTVYVDPERPEWTELSYAGRVRTVKATGDEVVAWIKAGSK